MKIQHRELCNATGDSGGSWRDMESREGDWVPISQGQRNFVNVFFVLG